MSIQGETQGQIMAALWRVGSGTVEQVREELPPRYQGAYNTVQTVLNRLTERGLLERERAGRGFVLRDLPKTEDQLRKLPPFEFENWAVLHLDGLPNKAKVGDMGMDGKVFPVSSLPERRPS